MNKRILLVISGISMALYLGCFVCILLLQESLVIPMLGYLESEYQKIYPLPNILGAILQTVLYLIIFVFLWKNTQEEYVKVEPVGIVLMAGFLILSPVAGKLSMVIFQRLYALGGAELLAIYSVISMYLNMAYVLLIAAQVFLLIHACIQYGAKKKI